MIPQPSQKLKLPQSPRAAIFRVIDRQLRNDANLRRYVRDGSFRSWTGDPADNNAFTIAQMPSIRLTPTSNGEQFWANDSLLGTLLIEVEMHTAGLCWDDNDALWMAVQRALYPNNPAATEDAVQNTLIRALQAAGAHKGISDFSAGPIDKAPGEGDAFVGTGIIRIEYRVSVRS